MQMNRAKVDRYTYEWATHRNKDRVQWYRDALVKFDADPEKSKRLEKVECRTCFYFQSPRMVCQAFTERQCGVCGKEQRFCNSDTDVVCPDCARERGLCSHCGGDLNDKLRRKVDLSHKDASA
jgi:hypothetical protein